MHGVSYFTQVQRQGGSEPSHYISNTEDTGHSNKSPVPTSQHSGCKMAAIPDVTQTLIIQIRAS